MIQLHVVSSNQHTCKLTKDDTKLITRDDVLIDNEDDMITIAKKKHLPAKDDSM